MEAILFAGDAVFTIGLAIVALIFGVKLVCVLLKKEFELFKFLLKLGVAVIIGGGLMLFMGRRF